MSKPASETKAELTALLEKQSSQSAPPPKRAEISTPKTQTIYLRAAEQKSLRQLRISLANLDAEAQQPSTSEIVRVALRLLPKDIGLINVEMQSLRSEDGRR